MNDPSEKSVKPLVAASLGVSAFGGSRRFKLNEATRLYYGFKELDAEVKAYPVGDLQIIHNVQTDTHFAMLGVLS